MKKLLPKNKKKVFIGPLDTGSNNELKRVLQAAYWVVTCNFVSSPFTYPSDINLGIDRMSKRRAAWQVAKNFFLSLSYDIYHFRFGQSLLPWNIDLPLLKILGKKMIMTFDGDDLRQVDRLPKDRAGQILADYYRQILNIRFKDPVRRLRHWWVKLWVNQIVVATPDLLTFAPEADYITNFTSIASPKCLESTSHRQLIIFHAPTDSGIKGTRYIQSAVKKLGPPFVLEIAKNIPKEKMRLEYQKADIVVDQLLIGAFGQVSIEAMAQGRPVICFIRPEVKIYYPEDLPILNATIDDLTRVLITLKNNRYRKSIAKKSYQFAKKNLSAEAIGKKWLKIYQKF